VKGEGKPEHGQGQPHVPGEVTSRSPSPQRGEGWGEGGRTTGQPGYQESWLSSKTFEKAAPAPSLRPRERSRSRFPRALRATAALSLDEIDASMSSKMLAEASNIFG
jgi:hypothetical protein